MEEPYDAVPVRANREERLAYLEGLAEGIQDAEAAATASLLAGIVDVLGEISDEVRHLRWAQRDLESDVEDLADELTAETQDIVVTCPSCGSDVAFAANLLEEEEVELTCPNCGEVVYTPGEDELVEGDRQGWDDGGPREEADHDSGRFEDGLEGDDGLEGLGAAAKWQGPRGDGAWQQESRGHADLDMDLDMEAGELGVRGGPDADGGPGDRR